MPYRRPPFEKYKPQSIRSLLGARDMVDLRGINAVPTESRTMGDVRRQMRPRERAPFPTGSRYRQAPPPQFSVDRFNTRRVGLPGLLGGVGAGWVLGDYLWDRLNPPYSVVDRYREEERLRNTRRPTIENARRLGLF